MLTNRWKDQWITHWYPTTTWWLSKPHSIELLVPSRMTFVYYLFHQLVKSPHQVIIMECFTGVSVLHESIEPTFVCSTFLLFFACNKANFVSHPPKSLFFCFTFCVTKMRKWVDSDVWSKNVNSEKKSIQILKKCNHFQCQISMTDEGAWMKEEFINIEEGWF
jgi:hypothetical protein